MLLKQCAFFLKMHICKIWFKDIMTNNILPDALGQYGPGPKLMFVCRFCLNKDMPLKTGNNYQFKLRVNLAGKGAHFLIFNIFGCWLKILAQPQKQIRV